MAANLYLTGFMGAGKTTTAEALGRLLGRPVVDCDRELEKRFGRSIPEVFAREGEAVFRAAEHRLLASLAKRDRLVVSTGGGLPMDPANRGLMRSSGKVIFLSADLGVCRLRVCGDGADARPLWRDQATLEALYQDRQPAYGDCDLTLAVGDCCPDEAAVAVAEHLLKPLEFPATLGTQTCPVVATLRGPQTLAKLREGRRVAILCDRNLAKLHLDRYRAELRPDLEVVLPPGEHSKTLNGARKVYEALLGAGLGRGDLLIALGGGMITDLGAFVAATFKRGMDFALVSTSLLGAVDAAVGGKAAVNLGADKNMVGLFTLPRMVVLDQLALSTLPRAQRSEGLVEAYKMGLLNRPALAAAIEQNLKYLLKGDLEELAQAAAVSAQAKAEVVAEDFTERGLRRILNLGHTYGHAVEGWHRFRVSHGRAVAAGLAVALWVSHGRGLVPLELAQRVTDTLADMVRLGFQLPPVADAWPHMVNDKKNIGGKVLFVLLEGVGRPVVVDDVTPDQVAAAVARVREAWHV